MITLETFHHIDLRVAQVVQAEVLPRAKRVFKLLVDLNGERRSIIADLAQFYEPEEIIGRQVVVIANLPPSIIHGERSHGKLLVVHGPGEVLSFVVPDRATSSGAPVR